MSLAERLIVLHVGSTAALLLVLVLVTAVRHAVETMRARWRPAPPVISMPRPERRPAQIPEPGLVDLRFPREPSVAGGIRRSS